MGKKKNKGKPVAPKTSSKPKLNSKNISTLKAIFEKPTRSNIPWTDIVTLLVSLGAIIDTKRSGSRVAVKLRERKGLFHAPHPSPATDKGAVASIRKLLLRCGITHDEI